jgi:hypothetical protein
MSAFALRASAAAADKYAPCPRPAATEGGRHDVQGSSGTGDTLDRTVAKKGSSRLPKGKGSDLRAEIYDVSGARMRLFSRPCLPGAGFFLAS